MHHNYGSNGNGNPHTGPALLKDLALRANRGIQLTRCTEHGLVAQPLGPSGRPDPQSFQLPLVPGHILEYGSGFLRHIWRARGTSAVWWLYAHPKQKRWWAYCPPQLCSCDDIQVDATFKDCPTPDPDLLLAGSLRTDPRGGDNALDAGPLLAAHQGVHFLLDLSRPLTCLSAYLRTDRGVEPVPAIGLIDDPLDPSLAYLSDRLMFRTRTSIT